MPNLNLPKRQNIESLLKVLDLQQSFQTGIHADLAKDWHHAIPTEDFNLLQHDTHSCGVHLLLHADAYLQQREYSRITSKNIRIYRHQLVENILRKAIPLDSDFNETVSNSSSSANCSTISFQNEDIIRATEEKIDTIRKQRTTN